MKTLPLLIIISLVLTLGANTLCAQQYVYENQNASPQNAARALLVGKGGTLTAINGWATGGTGFATPALNNHSIAIAQPMGQTCLYASNGLQNTVAAFTINLLDGSITPVTGSPFSTGGPLATLVGLAVGGNQLLFATSGGISVLGINTDCSLNLLQNYPQLFAADLKVTPDGRFLITSDTSTLSVHSFRIDYDMGQLTQVGLSPAQGSPQGVAISCDNSTAYFADGFSTGTHVEVFSIGPAGELNELNDFEAGAFPSSGGVLLSPNQKRLYVTNTSGRLSVLSVGPRGKLKYHSTTDPLNGNPLDVMSPATCGRGEFVFVPENAPATGDEVIGVLQPRGFRLQELASSPFIIVGTPSLPSVAVYPPVACK